MFLAKALGLIAKIGIVSWIMIVIFFLNGISDRNGSLMIAHLFSDQSFNTQPRLKFHAGMTDHRSFDRDRRSFFHDGKVIGNLCLKKDHKVIMHF